MYVYKYIWWCYVDQPDQIQFSVSFRVTFNFLALFFYFSVNQFLNSFYLFTRLFILKVLFKNCFSSRMPLVDIKLRKRRKTDKCMYVCNYAMYCN